MTKDGELQVWNYETGSLVSGPIKGDRLEIASNPSPDGKYVVISQAENFQTFLSVWDIERKTPLFEWKPPGEGIWKATFDPDCKRVLFYPQFRRNDGFKYGASVVSIENPGQVISEIRPVAADGSLPAITQAKFAKKGEGVILACKDKTVRLWNANSGNPMSEPVMVWSSTPKFAVSDDDRSVTVFRADGSAQQFELPVVDTVIPPDLIDVLCRTTISPGGSVAEVGFEDWLEKREALLADMRNRPNTDSWKKLVNWLLQNPWDRKVFPGGETALEDWLCSRILVNSEEPVADLMIESMRGMLPPEFSAEFDGDPEKAEAFRDLLAGAMENQGEGSLSEMLRRLDPGHPLWPLHDAVKSTSVERREYLMGLATSRLASAFENVVKFAMDALLQEFYTPDHHATLNLADAMVRKFPEMAEAHRLRGYALARRGNYEEAGAELKRSMEISTLLKSPIPSNTTMPLVAVAWITGERDNAIHLYGAAIRGNPFMAGTGWMTPKARASLSEPVINALMEVRAAALKQQPELRKLLEDAEIDFTSMPPPLEETHVHENAPQPMDDRRIDNPLLTSDALDQTFAVKKIPDYPCSFGSWPDQGWEQAVGEAEAAARGPNEEGILLSASRQKDGMAIQLIVTPSPGQSPTDFEPGRHATEEELMKAQRFSLEGNGMEVSSCTVAKISGQSVLRTVAKQEVDGQLVHMLAFMIPGEGRLYVLQAMSLDAKSLDDAFVKKCLESFRCEGSKAE